MKKVLQDNAELFKMLAESEKEPYNNLTWLDDDGLYRAWTFNKDKNRYYFDDVGDESFMEVWGNIFMQEKSQEKDSMWEGKLVEL
jgi:hypothetical protein